MSSKESPSSGDNRAPYYLARPRSGPGKPVLVLHAWWGLNPFVKQFCDRLAREGFTALAPDLYHGVLAFEREQAEKLSARLDHAAAEKEIMQAAAQLQAIDGTSTRDIGVVGFSLGGSLALWLAAQPSSPVVATVVFYATRDQDYSLSRSAFQFHLADLDEFEPASQVEQQYRLLRAVGRPALFYTYERDRHWFFENDRQDVYDAVSAKLAWARTVQFLKTHL